MTRTIAKLLIANRGEIARRIIRTAHDMGIRTVAVFADPDADAPFVAEAGEAVALGGSSSTQTYLDIAKVLDAARATGADGVHPGYGFLAENANFARAVIDAGLIWVGPIPDAIAAMGDKLRAKEIADAAGVPILRSGGVGDAEAIGYPLLIKASAGGGGKGMRIVNEPSELDAQVAAAQRESASAFGDDTVFLERYLPAPRHVEIQVLADSHGTIVHLGERECSIQRRHQKIVEEAPSPAMTPELRQRMGAAAIAAAQSVGYTSTGTVEFLLDDGEFFFLEMNTRLQVEHPVTEAICGLDLVRCQLRVAMGEPLGFDQSDVTLSGHAVEVRLYAEDPAADFLPATGTLTTFVPPSSPAARWDSGVETGSVVGVEFDPMLAKVIVHAPTRTEAALRLALALERLSIGGVVTNRDFLVATLRHEAFLAGDTTTDFISRHSPARTRVPDGDELANAAIVAALAAQVDARRSATELSFVPSGFRNSSMPAQSRVFSHASTEDTLDVHYRGQRDGTFTVDCGDLATSAAVHGRDGDTIEVTVGSSRATYRTSVNGSRWSIHGPSGQVELTEQPRFPERVVELPSGGLVAPMPGKVLAVNAAVGDSVHAGQLLVLLEAMKMEHHITAPTAGTVNEVLVAIGDQVENGALLLIIEE